MKRRFGAAPTNNPAEPVLQPADEIQPLDEHLPAVEPPVAVGVFEDEDAIAALVPLGAHRIGVCFGDPQAAAIVQREGDRPDDVGLGGGDLDGESLRHGHRPRRFRGRQALVYHRIHRRHQQDVRRGRLVREEGPRRVEPEAIEVDVRPGILADVRRRRRARLVVDDSYEDIPPHIRLQVDDGRPQPRVVGAGDGVDRLLVVGGHDLDARALEGAARHEEAGERLRHLEGHRRQRALSRAAAHAAAHPIRAGVAADDAGLARCRLQRGRRPARPGRRRRWPSSSRASRIRSRDRAAGR